MYRLAVSAVAIGMLVTGCFGPMVTAPVDAACQEHADPVDCQAALEVALDGLTLDPERFTVVVAPISCDSRACTTSVSSLPNADEDCLPSYEVELTRGPNGPWTVLSSSHGDPACAFES
jgi:hypothetical protein